MPAFSTPYARAAVLSGSARIGKSASCSAAKRVFVSRSSVLAMNQATSNCRTASPLARSHLHSAVHPPVNAFGNHASTTVRPRRSLSRHVRPSEPCSANSGAMSPAFKPPPKRFIMKLDDTLGSMSLAARFGLVMVLTCALGCNSGSPTSPDDDDDPPATNPPVTGQIVSGTAVDALTDSGAPSISLAATNGAALGTTAADGAFQVGFSTAGVNRITMSGPGFVERQTGVQAPGA